MKPESMLQYAREWHNLEVPDERTDEIARAVASIAAAIRKNRGRLTFDDAPHDQARLLRRGC